MCRRSSEDHRRDGRDADLSGLRECERFLVNRRRKLTHPCARISRPDSGHAVVPSCATLNPAVLRSTGAPTGEATWSVGVPSGGKDVSAIIGMYLWLQATLASLDVRLTASGAERWRSLIAANPGDLVNQERGRCSPQQGGGTACEFFLWTIPPAPQRAE